MRKTYRSYGKDSTSWMKLEDWLTQGFEFVNSTKSFRGLRKPGWPINTGRLPDKWRVSAQNPANDFIVWSYDTPIAWHHPQTGWIIPDVKYSNTTTAHQNKIRTALHATYINGHHRLPV